MKCLMSDQDGNITTPSWIYRFITLGRSFRSCTDTDYHTPLINLPTIWAIRNHYSTLTFRQSIRRVIQRLTFKRP